MKTAKSASEKKSDLKKIKVASSRPNGIWWVGVMDPLEVKRKRCYTITIFDVCSRKMLACRAITRPLIGEVKQVLEDAFEEFGLPEKIATKARAPFVTTLDGGLSRLEVWWIKLGIAPDRIELNTEALAEHTDLHLLIRSNAERPLKSDLRSRQQPLDAFKTEYNSTLRQKKIGNKVPDRLYKASSKKFNERTPGITYPDNYKLEKVYPNGVITVDETQWYINNSLKNEIVGLELISSGIWRVYFGSLMLGYIDQKTAVKVPGRRRSGVLVRQFPKV